MSRRSFTSTQTKSLRTPIHKSTPNQSVLFQQVIQEKNEQLRSLAKEQDELRNKVSMAFHTIMELKAMLAKKKYSFSSTKNQGHLLRLEAAKLKHEDHRLIQRCENATWETAKRLQVKNEMISSTQAKIDKKLILYEEAKKRNQILREALEKSEKISVGLKTKLSLTANWTVRQASRSPSPDSNV